MLSLQVGQPPLSHMEIKANLLQQAFTETGKLSAAITLAQQAWHFLSPPPLLIWTAPLVASPDWAEDPAPRPPASPGAAVGAGDGMGTRVAPELEPVAAGTHLAEAPAKPITPIAQIYQPPTPAGVDSNPIPLETDQADTGREEEAPEHAAATAEPSARIWTAADEVLLRRLYHEGKSDRQIGQALGRTQKAVSVRIGKLKLKQEGAGKAGDGDGG